MTVIKLDFDRNQKAAESQIQRINSLIEKEEELMIILNSLAEEIDQETKEYDTTFRKLVKEKGFHNLEPILYEYTTLVAVSLDEKTNDVVYTYTGGTHE